MAFSVLKKTWVVLIHSFLRIDFNRMKINFLMLHSVIGRDV